MNCQVSGPEVREGVAVGAEHRLRRARGAGGEDDRLGVPRLDRTLQRDQSSTVRVKRGLVQDREALDDGRRAADGHQGLQIGQPDRGQPGRKLGVGDHDAGVGARHHVLQQPALVGRVDGHVDGAHVVGAQEDAERIGAVGQPREHVIALAQAESLQADGGLDHLGAGARVAPLRAVLEDAECLFRRRRGQPVEQVAQHAPVRRRYAWVAVRHRRRVFHYRRPLIVRQLGRPPCSPEAAGD